MNASLSLSRRRFIASAAAAITAIAIGSTARARMKDFAGDDLHNVALVGGVFQYRPIRPDEWQAGALPPVFAANIHGHLMAPKFPEGCRVDFQTLLPGESIRVGDACFIRNAAGQVTFRSVLAVRRDDVLLVSLNRQMPVDVFAVQRSEMASVAVPTGVFIPVAMMRAYDRANKKSGGRNRLPRPAPASKGTRRAMGPTAA